MTTERKIRPGDPGQWQAHHVLLPESPGDFTPVTVDEYHGEEHKVHGPLGELLAVLVPVLEDREAGG